MESAFLSKTQYQTPLLSVLAELGGTEGVLHLNGWLWGTFYAWMLVPLVVLAASPHLLLPAAGLVLFHLAMPNGHAIDRTWSGHPHHLAPAVAVLTVAAAEGGGRILRWLRHPRLGRAGTPLVLLAMLGLVALTASRFSAHAIDQNLRVSWTPKNPAWIHPAWALAEQLPDDAIPAVPRDLAPMVSDRRVAYTYDGSLDDKATDEGLTAATHALIDTRQAERSVGWWVRGMPGAKLLGHDGPYQLWTWDADVEEDPRWAEMQGRRIRKEQPYLHPYKRRRDIRGGPLRVARHARRRASRASRCRRGGRAPPIRRPGRPPQPSRGALLRRQVERQDDVVDPGAIGQLDEAPAAPLLHEAHGPVGPRACCRRGHRARPGGWARGAPCRGGGGARRPSPGARPGPAAQALALGRGVHPQRQHRAMGQQRGAEASDAPFRDELAARVLRDEAEPPPGEHLDPGPHARLGRLPILGQLLEGLDHPPAVLDERPLQLGGVQRVPDADGSQVEGGCACMDPASGRPTLTPARYPPSRRPCGRGPWSVMSWFERQARGRDPGEVSSEHARYIRAAGVDRALAELSGPFGVRRYLVRFAARGARVRVSSIDAVPLAWGGGPPASDPRGTLRAQLEKALSRLHANMASGPAWARGAAGVVRDAKGQIDIRLVFDEDADQAALDDLRAPRPGHPLEAPETLHLLAQWAPAIADLHARSARAGDDWSGWDVKDDRVLLLHYGGGPGGDAPPSRTERHDCRTLATYSPRSGATWRRRAALR